MKTINKALAGISILACVLAGGAISPASALDIDSHDSSNSKENSDSSTQQLPPPRTVEVWQVQNKAVANRNWKNLGEQIALCAIGTANSTCTITRGKQATVTVQTGLGMSTSAASAQLGLSAGSAVTVSVACTSPPLPAGRIYRAYAVGTRYSYNIRYVRTFGFVVQADQTGGPYYAFTPDSSSIYCV